ncbi:hypothetical protein [Pseudoalteromonas sp. TAB23]|uniref:hypothetical protein n=1 Tax=Pseudoalteromonas sp. TAB23 TaxID=1938595 RepID=UPI0004187DC7|nr:hypothetical protein [Pseudoalteromonas sp. TAB23]
MTDNKFIEADRFIEAKYKELGKEILDITGRPLVVLEIAKKAGTYTCKATGNEFNQLYTVGSNENELDKIINVAKSQIVYWEALMRIFKDLNTLQRPIPKNLADFILDQLGENKKGKPRTPQEWTNYTRDFLIRIIAFEAREKFRDIPMKTTGNRQGDRQSESICSLIAKHVNRSEDSIYKIVKSKKRKST